MKIQYMYFVVGLIGGVFFCTMFPKIPIGIRNFIEEYKKQQRAKKESKKNGTKESSQQN